MPALPCLIPPRLSMPALPNCACPSRALPSLPCLNKPCRASPRLSRPAMPNQTKRQRTAPLLACRAVPNCAVPRPAGPCLPLQTRPFQSPPLLTLRSLACLTSPCQSLPSQYLPGLLWFKRCKTWLLLRLLCRLEQLGTIQIHILRLLCYQDDQHRFQPVSRNGSPN